MNSITSPLDRRRHLTGIAFITPTMLVIIAILVYPAYTRPHLGQTQREKRLPRELIEESFMVRMTQHL